VVGWDEGGAFYVAGFTRSPDFPTTADGFDETYNAGTSDAFISHFDSGVDTMMIFLDGFESGDLSIWK